MDIDGIRKNKRIFFIYYVGTIIDFGVLEYVEQQQFWMSRQTLSLV
jgi:hypothetical protein